MPKGPLNGPRPFTEYRLIIDPHEADIYIQKVGPLGGPRPFAKNNPPITEDRVNQCVISDAGRRFGAGVVSGGATTNIQELDAENTLRALQLAERWCRGTIEAQTMEDMPEGRATEIREEIERQLNEAIQAEGEVQLELLEEREDLPDIL